MAIPFESRFTQTPSPEAKAIDRMGKEFKKMIDDGGYTGEQVWRAYMRSLLSAGEIAQDDAEAEEAVIRIEGRMRQMADAGFPVNRFAEMADVKKQIEAIVPSYYRFVDTLAITDEEKKMLKSLVENKQTGRVECYSDDYMESVFSVIGDAGSPELLATMIQDYIAQFLREIGSAKKYRFLFHEA